MATRVHRKTTFGPCNIRPCVIRSFYRAVYDATPQRWQPRAVAKAEQKRGRVFAPEISDRIIAADAMTLTYNALEPKVILFLPSRSLVLAL